ILTSISAPHRITATFSEIERELGFTGLSDFYFAPPIAFEGPKKGEQYWPYDEGHTQRIFQVIPSLGRLAAYCRSLATPNTVYVAAPLSFADSPTRKQDATHTFAGN